MEKRLPNNVNISLPNISDPEMAVLQLDKAGIACSTKSSCLKGEENSYVVETLGGQTLVSVGKDGASDDAEKWRSRNTLRFTFSAEMGRGEVDEIIKALRDI